MRLRLLPPLLAALCGTVTFAPAGTWFSPLLRPAQAQPPGIPGGPLSTAAPRSTLPLPSDLPSLPPQLGPAGLPPGADASTDQSAPPNEGAPAPPGAQADPGASGAPGAEADPGGPADSGAAPGAVSQSVRDHLPREARAVWVVRDSLLGPRQVHAIVERAYRYHFNALMVQVRGRGDAYYHSSFDPRAQDLSDAPESFDPLAQAVTEAHRRGIKVYAWVNACLVWSGKRQPWSSSHVVRQHPDWIDAHADGTPMRSTEYEGQFLNPGIPAMRRYTVGVCADIVRHYNVDGIQLDYIRYPSPTVGYNREALAAFYAERHPGERIPAPHLLRLEARNDPAGFTLWRQQQVTELVREIRQAVQAIRPWASISAAVWADLGDARWQVLQDWPTWLQEGLLDFACPMAYSKSTAVVVRQIRQAVTLAGDRQVWAGLGAWQLTPESTMVKIDAVRQLGVSGVCLFSYGGITSYGQSESFLARLCHGKFQQLASLPPMPWLPAVRTASLPPAGSPGRS